MPKFLCVQRSLKTSDDAAGGGEEPSPAQMQEMYARFGEWQRKFETSLVDVGGKLGEGKLVTVDPDVYVVLDEKLFLFSNADARTAFENEEPGIVQVADGKWAEIESELAQKKGCFSCF